MRETAGRTRLLTAHFFRRFFDNDTVQPGGDITTVVVRALAIVAVPGLMVAFFLQNQYPRRALWGAIEDQYFFVLFSFVILGAVSVFEWEMLFPDKMDFLILSPLPLRPRELLLAKGVALLAFLLLFLFSCNVLGVVVYALASKGPFFRHLYAQGAATTLAGTFAAFAVLAIRGVSLSLLPETRLRFLPPLLQMLLTAALVVLLLHYAQYGDSLEALFTSGFRAARWLPPLWFLAVYDRLLYGTAAPAFARDLTPYALRGTFWALSVASLTYPVGWIRMQRSAIEGASPAHRPAFKWFQACVHRLVHRPAERAVFHFIGQTIRRNNRYQVYLAMYSGTGLAIAIACAVQLHFAQGRLQLHLSSRGLHAMLPLLLCWLVAGLRTAFAFPLNLAASWIFRVTGTEMTRCAEAAGRWVLFGAAALTVCVAAALAALGWNSRQLLVQAVCGLCLCVLLTDSFFFQRRIPFTHPRMPGRTNFALMLTLYIGVFAPFLYGVVYLETILEKRPLGLLWMILATASLHVVLRARREPMEVEEEMEGYEGEFQVLGLS